MVRRAALEPSVPLPLAAVPIAVFGALFLAAGEEEERESGFNGDLGSGRPEVMALEGAAIHFARIFGRTIVPWPDGQVVRTEGVNRARIRFTGSSELSPREKAYVQYLVDGKGMSDASIRLQPGRAGSGEPNTIELALTR